MAKRRVATLNELRQIEGIGEMKTTTFGQRFLDAIQTMETFSQATEEAPQVDGNSNRLFEAE